MRVVEPSWLIRECILGALNCHHLRILKANVLNNPKARMHIKGHHCQNAGAGQAVFHFYCCASRLREYPHLGVGMGTPMPKARVLLVLDITELTQRDFQISNVYIMDCVDLHRVLELSSSPKIIWEITLRRFRQDWPGDWTQSV